jgi:REP element-mobilizing transposase RayT
MPSHIHVLFSPHPNETAGRTIGGWKGISARRIHQQMGLGSTPVRTSAAHPANCPLWQAEYWDTLVRSPCHLKACQRYIANNPARANLAAFEYTVWQSAPAG